MAKIIIYFQDLKDETRDEIWQTVREELIDNGDIEPRREDETEAEFEERVLGEVDDYINRHNFANEFFV